MSPVVDLTSSKEEEEEVRKPSAKSSKESRAYLKRWCFTLYPSAYDNSRRVREDIAAMGESASYLVAGKETCPKTGKKHYQGFVVFKERTRFSKLKKDFDASIHWEPTRGTAEQNYEYCSKEDKDPIIYGEIPEEDAGQREKKRWREAREACEDGRMEDCADDIFIRYHGNLSRIQNAVNRSTTPLLEPHNFWLWGVPGSGKSHMARNHWVPDYGTPYLKGLNKWWDGYHKHEVVVIEDIDPSHVHMANHLKIWSDMYPFPAEVKGSQVQIRPKLIVVTSNYAIEDIFNGVDSEAIRRRFKVKHFPFVYGREPPSGDVCEATPPRQPRIVLPSTQLEEDEEEDEDENEDEPDEN